MQSGTLQIHQQVCHNLLPQTNSQCPFRDLLYIAGGNKIAARSLLAGLAESLDTTSPQNNIQIS